MKKIYLDFDGTIVNTIKNIVDLYNYDFQYEPGFQPVNWTEINSWNFEELKLANLFVINSYFNKKIFFDTVEFMDNAKEVIDKLSDDGYKLVVVSMGTTANLKGKAEWIQKNLPDDIQFMSVNTQQFANKAHIDMSDGILIDDVAHNLETSNALEKICFGDIYSWNENWQGERCFNWYEVYNKITGKEME